MLIPPANNWKDTPLSDLKFVNDFIGVGKLISAISATLYSQAKTTSKIHAKKSQEIFDVVKTNAHDVGMSVNPSKT